MSGFAAFERHHQRYEEWFTRHGAAYHSELLALRLFQPWQGFGLEIGVGSGCFAAPLGVLCMGFIDRGSTLGRFYQAHRHENVFYRDAVFYSSSEMEALLKQAGFGQLDWAQTLFGPLEKMTEIEPVHQGHGDGGFVVVRAG